jgi:hypothetical protein
LTYQCTGQLTDLPEHGPTLLFGNGEHGLHVPPDGNRYLRFETVLKHHGAQSAEQPRCIALTDDQIPFGVGEPQYYTRISQGYYQW